MQALETVDALSLVGINRTMWNDSLARGYFTEAPTAMQGVPRYFDCDDMVALFTMDHFNRLGMGPSMSGRIASAVRVELRKGGENLKALWVVATKSGKPQRVVSKQPPGDLFHHEIPVEKLRREIERLAAQRLGVR